MYALLYWLLSLAYDGVKTGELSPSQRTFLGLTRDVRNELNVAKVLIGGTEFNAPSLNFAQNVYNDMSDVFDGKLNLGRAFINNFGALRPLRYSLYEYFPNPEYEHTAVTDLF